MVLYSKFVYASQFPGENPIIGCWDIKQKTSLILFGTPCMHFSVGLGVWGCALLMCLSREGGVQYLGKHAYIILENSLKLKTAVSQDMFQLIFSVWLKYIVDCVHLIGNLWKLIWQEIKCNFARPTNNKKLLSKGLK